MRKKPLLFTIVPLILIAVCASFYFQTAYVLQTPLTDYKRILSKLTTSNWITIASMIISGVLILRSSKWARLAMPITIGIVFWNNYLVSTYSSHFTKEQVIIGALLFAVLFTPLFTKKMQAVLADRNMQWWRVAFRKKNQIPVTLVTNSGQRYSVQSHDVSKTGLFLRFDNEPWDTLPRPGESVQLYLKLQPQTTLHCMATVVRLVEPKGFYPRGIGLRLDKLPTQDQKTLEDFIDKKDNSKHTAAG